MEHGVPLDLVRLLCNSLACYDLIYNFEGGIYMCIVSGIHFAMLGLSILAVFLFEVLSSFL